MTDNDTKVTTKMAMYHPVRLLVPFRDKPRSRRKSVSSVFFDEAGSSYNINSQSFKTRVSERNSPTRVHQSGIWSRSFYGITSTKNK
ncbi:unnamed protein product [Lasius platythorax]